ncbi:Rad1-domain-containing protein [Guyanagaster necrorhizus]|uniref:Rad1-domain-containing protein n=1 Tax=Guyanagaster necrorhizus TaxID=856835 RepID=A0A9P7W6U6_9AGAR|nr:Rad1-domain-containing protein [Guyanagaster necrorhizus MCA 3950]KAG7453030.1 Rad1-domain-containing protein [Guyanagaster necrorhizus MCA 3950]
MLPVLKASVHDVRYFVTLLRGVNFVNRATITVTERGFIAVVEEARTLLGTAYIFSDVFDEYEYNSESPGSTQDSADDEDNAAFEVPLNTLIECLNIFGTAGGTNYNASGGGRHNRWKKVGDNDDGDDGDDDDGGRGKIQQFFGGSSEKRTGMRMSYAGAGYPLTLLLAEDSTGPTTTCEISTYDAEPHLELPFDLEKMVLKVILKSEWLRDALSELDPSCEKLTFIGNPPPTGDPSQPRQKQKANSRVSLKPMLRIKATGTFGSTEMDYPNDRDVLETFDCAQSISFSYRFAHISRTLRALQSSTKTSLRIDDEGLLSLQFLMPSPSPKQGKKDEGPAAFIEFRCLALDDDQLNVKLYV